MEDLNNKKIGYAQKAFIFNDKGQFLIARRSSTHPYNAYWWDIPGGKLEHGENTEDCIKREIKEETGLEIKDIVLMDNISAFNEKEEFWVTAIYKCRAVSEEVVLSYEHDEFLWVTQEEFEKFEKPEGNKKFVKFFIDESLSNKESQKAKFKRKDFNAKIELGKYRHFKGKEYEVLGVAKHSETLGEFVVYRALYGEDDIWVRPFQMFIEEVETDDKKVKRFEKI